MAEEAASTHPGTQLAAVIDALVTMLIGCLSSAPKPSPSACERDQMFAFLLDHNQRFADAFGACVCWGHDRCCSWCEGRGRPGFRSLDSDLLAQMVADVCRADAALKIKLQTVLGDDR